jgi:signal transduction histidine kinase
MVGRPRQRREAADRAAEAVGRRAARRLAVSGTDRLRVEQVVSNLIDNAVKFGGGAAIEVRVSSDANEATLAVTDHGIGITPDDQQRIFERFERAAPARGYGGLGLGLYISRQIVEVMSGRITVTSHPQSGTTFTVTLPLRPSKAAASKAG